MNSKIYKIGFFILVVVNIVLVVVFTMRPKMPISQEGIKDHISQDLQFNKEQTEIFEEMAKNHREAMRDLERKEQDLVRSFFHHLSLNHPEGDKEVMLQEILQLKKDKIMITYMHFEELKGICNEEQLAGFDNVLKRVVPILTNSPGKAMNPGRPPRGGTAPSGPPR